MVRLWLALLAILIPAPALGQASEAARVWTRADGELRFMTGRMRFPERVGTIALARTNEGNDNGPGLDNAAFYESADRQIHATVYVYAPNLAHAGLSAYATDTFMRAHPQLAPRPLGTRLTDAGGQQGAAIRIDYANYRGTSASSAAFLKVDRWIVKLRVSGPEARRAEVDAAMTALLAGLRFDGRARPPEPLDPGACPGAPGRRAALLPSETADALEEALIGTVEHDGQARESDGADILTPRFGRAWCLSTLAQAGEVRLPILRSQMPPDGDRKRSVLVVPLSDSGRTLEVVETRRRGRFVVFFHQVGRSELWGGYDAVPNDEQIMEILGGGQARGPVRAIIARAADGNVNVTLQGPATAPAQPQT